MPGPTPKDPKIRQRTNKTTTAAKLTAVPGPSLEAFELPERTEGVWHPATVAWWRDVWGSPMAPEYLEADRHALLMLAVLVDAFWVNPSSSLAAEIRLQRQCFGLTPLDRRRLQWEIEKLEKPRARTNPTETKGKASAVDPRRALVAVPS